MQEAKGSSPMSKTSFASYWRPGEGVTAPMADPYTDAPTFENPLYPSAANLSKVCEWAVDPEGAWSAHDHSQLNNVEDGEPDWGAFNNLDAMMGATALASFTAGLPAGVDPLTAARAHADQQLARDPLDHSHAPRLPLHPIRARTLARLKVVEGQLAEMLAPAAPIGQLADGNRTLKIVPKSELEALEATMKKIVADHHRECDEASRRHYARSVARAETMEEPPVPDIPLSHALPPFANAAAYDEMVDTDAYLHPVYTWRLTLFQLQTEPYGFGDVHADIYTMVAHLYTRVLCGMLLEAEEMEGLYAPLPLLHDGVKGSGSVGGDANTSATATSSPSNTTASIDRSMRLLQVLLTHVETCNTIIADTVGEAVTADLPKIDRPFTLHVSPYSMYGSRKAFISHLLDTLIHHRCSPWNVFGGPALCAAERYPPRASEPRCFGNRSIASTNDAEDEVKTEGDNNTSTTSRLAAGSPPPLHYIVALTEQASEACLWDALLDAGYVRPPLTATATASDPTSSPPAARNQCNTRSLLEDTSFIINRTITMLHTYINDGNALLTLLSAAVDRGIEAVVAACEKGVASAILEESSSSASAEGVSKAAGMLSTLSDMTLSFVHTNLFTDVESLLSKAMLDHSRRPMDYYRGQLNVQLYVFWPSPQGGSAAKPRPRIQHLSTDLGAVLASHEKRWQSRLLTPHYASLMVTKLGAANTSVLSYTDAELRHTGRFLSLYHYLAESVVAVEERLLYTIDEFYQNVAVRGKAITTTTTEVPAPATSPPPSLADTLHDTAAQLAALGDAVTAMTQLATPSASGEAKKDEGAEVPHGTLMMSRAQHDLLGMRFGLLQCVFDATRRGLMALAGSGTAGGPSHADACLASADSDEEDSDDYGNCATNALIVSTSSAAAEGDDVSTVTANRFKVGQARVAKALAKLLHTTIIDADANKSALYTALKKISVLVPLFAANPTPLVDALKPLLTRRLLLRPRFSKTAELALLKEVSLRLGGTGIVGCAFRDEGDIEGAAAANPPLPLINRLDATFPLQVMLGEAVGYRAATAIPTKPPHVDIFTEQVTPAGPALPSVFLSNLIGTLMWPESALTHGTLADHTITRQLAISAQEVGLKGGGQSLAAARLRKAMAALSEDKMSRGSGMVAAAAMGSKPKTLPKTKQPAATAASKVATAKAAPTNTPATKEVLLDHNTTVLQQCFSVLPPPIDAAITKQLAAAKLAAVTGAKMAKRKAWADAQRPASLDKLMPAAAEQQQKGGEAKVGAAKAKRQAKAAKAAASNTAPTPTPPDEPKASPAEEIGDQCVLPGKMVAGPATLFADLTLTTCEVDIRYPIPGGAAGSHGVCTVFGTVPQVLVLMQLKCFTAVAASTIADATRMPRVLVRAVLRSLPMVSEVRSEEDSATQSTSFILDTQALQASRRVVLPPIVLQGAD